LACAAVAGSAAVAQEAEIRAHLAVGEFAPAVALARQVPDARQRDALLADVAAAQVAAGARDASLLTAAEISDDRTRTAALGRMAGQPWGARGGGVEADFDSLIELITSTVKPQTWDEVGGPGSVAPFPTGVYIDPDGVLQSLLGRDTTGQLAALRRASLPGVRHDDARRTSPLRKVSLTRLERAAQLRLAAGKPLTEEMQVLAGLQRVQYVFVYPESGDLVLAGPAGDWRWGAENRILSVETGLPVVRLDDLVVVLRHAMASPAATFGCLITPRREALARTQAFLKESANESIPVGGRARWLEQLRASVGTQDIEVYGLDPRTRAARVMVEADYRMKLVGMGLEEGVPGVRSYLDLIEVPPGQAPPPMDVLRWWFTLDYDAVAAAEDRNAFAMQGQALQVLSENEKLAADGQRIHTGQAEELNRQFAQSFTQHFDALCQKYPIYAELRNICDLALACTLMREEELPGKVGWHMTFFRDADAFEVELAPAPREVDTVINHRVIHRVHVLAGVSGGVRVDPNPLVAAGAVQVDRYGELRDRRGSAPREMPAAAWWWD
jgi:hypothetical protein